MLAAPESTANADTNDNHSECTSPVSNTACTLNSYPLTRIVR
jgi:hypothetical protein